MSLSKISLSKMTVAEFLESRVRDREAMRKAARHMDELRKRCGKPEKGFDSLTVLRKLREAR
jgi:hypothetical protein